MDKPTEHKVEHKVLKVLDGERYDVPPVWLMRQAGRYLPEYRETRKQAGSFLDLCYNPELAIEVTMQPIRRFGFDAAILFSDILVIPDALGRDVRFVEGEGPKLDPITTEEIDQLSDNVDFDNAMEHLVPVLQTVEGLRGELPDEVTLLGFCGAPWTVATYMIAGHGTTDQAPARLFSFKHPELFQKLMDVLVKVSARYLIAQLKAGADAVQLFDSWASVFSANDFDKWCRAPAAEIVRLVRAEIPDAKIIGFPKGAAWNLTNYREDTKVNCLGLDWTVNREFAQSLQKAGPVQGNLDPMRLVGGGKALDEGVDMVMETFGDGPLIFNLGHGITPQAPIENVEHLLKRIRG